jgi:hypothetical protein
MTIDCSRFRTVNRNEVSNQAIIDAARANRRKQARAIYRDSTNPNDRRAVQLAGAGYGVQFLVDRTGIDIDVARRLVTGE